VLQLWEQADQASRHADIPTIRARARVQPQDKDSGLVEREWRWTCRRSDIPTERSNHRHRVSCRRSSTTCSISGAVSMLIVRSGLAS
jgi:hypothetical protein